MNFRQTDHNTPCSSGSASSTESFSSSPVKTTYCSPSNMTSIRLGPLPANLDDLKVRGSQPWKCSDLLTLEWQPENYTNHYFTCLFQVSELRQQLRIRGLPVSGTKTSLIERLRPYRDANPCSPSSSRDITTVTFPVTPTGSLSSYQSPSSSGAMSHTTGYYPYCSTTSTPPISPASSDLSVSNSLPDSFSDVTMSSPHFALQASPSQLSTDDGQNLGKCLHGEAGPDMEKDKMLVEKQKVIEELTWKLHQEQRQVEELRMQLHKRKHSHTMQESLHLQTHGQMQNFYGVSIKQEPLASSCPIACKQLKTASKSCMEAVGHCTLGNGLQNIDVPNSRSPSGLPSYLSPRCSPQDSPMTKNSNSPQPNSLPSSPNHSYLLPNHLARDCPLSVPYNGVRHAMQVLL